MKTVAYRTLGDRIVVMAVTEDDYELLSADDRRWLASAVDEEWTRQQAEKSQMKAESERLRRHTEAQGVIIADLHDLLAETRRQLAEREGRIGKLLQEARDFATRQVERDRGSFVTLKEPAPEEPVKVPVGFIVASWVMIFLVQLAILVSIWGHR